MPYVIGQASIVKVVNNGGSLSDPWRGIISFNFNDGRSFNPLYQLSNSLSPYKSVFAVEANSNPTVSINMYSGCKVSSTEYPNSYSFDAYTQSIDCDDSDLWVNIEFTPGLCTGSPDWNVNAYTASPSSVGSYGKFFVNSYSFSKEAQGFGQESWSFQAKPRTAILISSESASSFQTVMDSSIIQNEVDPDNIHMVKGIATGNVTGEFDEYNQLDAENYLARAGVEIKYNQSTNTTAPGPGQPYIKDKLAGRSIDVSAGQLSIGKANIVHNGFVESFGGSTLIRKDGIAVNASVSIPHNPVYQVST